MTTIRGVLNSCRLDVLMPMSMSVSDAIMDGRVSRRSPFNVLAANPSNGRFPKNQRLSMMVEFERDKFERWDRDASYWEPRYNKLLNDVETDVFPYDYSQRLYRVHSWITGKLGRHHFKWQDYMTQYAATREAARWFLQPLIELGLLVKYNHASLGKIFTKPKSPGMFAHWGNEILPRIEANFKKKKAILRKDSGKNDSERTP